MTLAVLVALLPARLACADMYAFIGVNIVPMDREIVIADQTVLVEDGLIKDIGAADVVAVPDDATQILAPQQYLLPGLAEMHAHIPPVRDRGGWLEDVLFLYVANGVTTARGMLGEPAHLELRDQISEHAILGPRIYTSGPSLNGNSVADPQDARDKVLAQAAAHYDFLKLHPGLSREEFDAIAATAEEAGISFAGHVGIDVGLDRALEAHQATIDHLDGYMRALMPPGESLPASIGFFGAALVELVDLDRIPLVARQTANARVWNVPTQSLIESFVLPEAPVVMAARPQMAYVPRATLDRWIQTKQRIVGDPDYDPLRAQRFVEIRAMLILALHEAGADLLLGSDAPQVFNVPGFSIHRELDALIAAGLSPYEALRTGTANPARFFGAGSRFGSVRVGQQADLILVTDNPLEDVRALRVPRGVMVRGRWLSRAALDEGLEAVARRYADR